MRIDIPDDLADGYAKHNPNLPVAQVCTNQLTRFQTVPPTERIIVIRSEERQAIEDALGGLVSLSSAADLLEAIRTRMAVSIGGVEIPFSNGALKNIQERAEREGIAPAVMAERVAKEALQGILDAV